MPDPTLELLGRLKDRSQWAAVREGVPICAPFRRAAKLKDGTTTVVEVTEADLPVLAAKARHLFDRYGVPLRVTAGHVIGGNDVNELTQPPVVGYATNVRVGVFGPQSLPCMMADLHYEREHYESCRDMPYRSPEYLIQFREVRGVALLKQDPYINMGMVTCGADDSVLACALSTGEDTMPEPITPPAPAVPPPAAPPVITPEQFETLRMQLDQQTAAFARLETSLTAVQTENAALRLARDRETCERMVIQLEAEGFQLVRDEEVKELLGRDDAGRTKYVERLRKCYRKGDPTTAAIPFSASGMVPVIDSLPNSAAGGEDVIDDATAKKVTERVRKTGESWDAARKAVVGK